MDSFQKAFHLILTSDEDTSRMAARSIRKLVYGNHQNLDELKDIINSSPIEYEKITDTFRQVNFVLAISVMYFLHDKRSQQDFLFPWLFQLLQHANGNIRHAAVRMIAFELGPLTYHIRFPGKAADFSDVTPQDAARMLFGLQTNLHALAENSWKPAYEKYVYIDDLPSGTYKSVQLILEVLEDYCSEVREPTLINQPEDLQKERARIDAELSHMLKLTKSAYTLLDIKLAIYNENEQKDFTRIIAMFENEHDIPHMDSVLALISEAWNYFPHKSLGGLSPAEKVNE